MLVGDVGVSLPTGSTSESPGGALSDRHYAYNMQLGSGTVDAQAGMTALSFQGPVQLGSHLAATLRNGKNSNGYRLGNMYRADVWADYNAGAGFTPRLVGYYKHKDAVQGEDLKYFPEKVSAAEQLNGNGPNEFYYHNQINWDLSAALKYTLPLGSVSFAAEAGIPVFQGSQNYDEVVVNTDYYANLSVSGQF